MIWSCQGRPQPNIDKHLECLKSPSVRIQVDGI